MSEKITAQEAIENLKPNRTLINASERMQVTNKYATAALDKAIELLQAEADGLLPRLPCKVGSNIFRIDSDPDITESDIETYTVDNYVICDDGEVLIKYDSYDGVICTVKNITDKTPYLDYYLRFITEEEALKALEEQKKKR